MKKQTVHKAVTSVIGGVLTIVGMITSREINVDPELIGAIGMLITSGLVWFVPNKEKKENV